MHEYLPGLSKLKPPPMHRVRQQFDTQHVPDVAAAVRDQLDQPAIAATLETGRTAAVAVGSRGIANIQSIVGTLVEQLQARGLKVFIVPSMGSHGGATAEGQTKVLAHLGITERTMGVPIRSSMEVVEVGTTRSSHGNDVPVYMDKIACEQADLVVPVVRIKPHTGFKGPVESGICKMITIGLGKHVGCSLLHREGMGVFDDLIPKAGRIVLQTGKIGFALCLIENAYEQMARVEAVAPEGAVEREGELLVEAKRRIARLLMPRIDVLVVEEFGKNISGVGMDANVTGRGELGGALPGFDGPQIERIVVLGLTEETYANAHGIGLADVITQQAFDQINPQVTWTNTLTAGSLGCGRLPIALPTTDQAIMAAASCVFGVKTADARIVRIKNTLCLTEIAVRESLLDTIAQTSGCELVGPWDGRWQTV